MIEIALGASAVRSSQLKHSGRNIDKKSALVEKSVRVLGHEIAARYNSQHPQFAPQSDVELPVWAALCYARSGARETRFIASATAYKANAADNPSITVSAVGAKSSTTTTSA
jgi:hypothetical protein